MSSDQNSLRARNTVKNMNKPINPMILNDNSSANLDSFQKIDQNNRKTMDIRDFENFETNQDKKYETTLMMP